MARVTLELPEKYIFTTEIPVRVTDLNYGGHLGNDALLAILHEARVRFLKSYGYTEQDIEGCGVIMVDAVIVYKAEGFYGDRLQVAVAVRDFNKYGCDIVYQVTNIDSEKEVARAKTGIVMFNYATRKIAKVPSAFTEALLPAEGK